MSENNCDTAAVHPPRVSTLSLVLVLATIYSWLFEWFLSLLQFFVGHKVDMVTHVSLISASIILSVGAYLRRREYRPMLAAVKAAALTPWQMVIVVSFVMAIVVLVTWASFRIEAN